VDEASLKYKVAREGVEIGEYTRSEVLQLYYNLKIKLTDHMWREGMTEWLTLYDIYTEFLNDPDQLRGYDREIQMTTKTSYRLKYLIEKSKIRIQDKKRAPKEFKKTQKHLEQEAEKIRNRIAITTDADELHDLQSELLQAEGWLDINSATHEGRDEDYSKMEVEETRDEIKTLENMRIAFWWSTFQKEPPKLNKKDLKRLAVSYENRVMTILRGGVPWSTNYFANGSFYYMPSCRTLHELHGKNYECPPTAEIERILGELDAENPDWDDHHPELFFSKLVR